MPAACELFLIRDWDAAWRAVIAPWLGEPASLRRDLVVVPTRGQAHALKLRCVREGLPLLGVEFLTPGLLRRKLRALSPEARLIMPPEWIRLHLEAVIADALAQRTREAPDWGFWKSLASDVDRALEEFAALQHAGFAGDDFGFAPLREAFGELERRVAAAGFEFAPVQERGRAAASAAGIVFGRVLIAGFGTEQADAFSILCALAARARSARVLVPEPDFDRPSRLAEAWVQRWERVLGVESIVPDEPGEVVGAAVADLWGGAGADVTAAHALVGKTREDEVLLVARQIIRLLASGARAIAVVFPQAGPAHLRLTRLLAEHDIPFNDLVEAVAPPAPDYQLAAGLLRFLRRGARLDEMLALWPWLQTIGATTATPAEARTACDRAFDETQDHAVAVNRARWESSEHVAEQEMTRVAGLLPEAWPESITLAEAAARFEAMTRAFRLPLPDGWNAFVVYSTRELRTFPSVIVLGALERMLPTKGAATDAPGRGRFAAITLTTRRRATACAWQHVILMHSNSGVWPRRSEPSVWLTDEQREDLNRRAGLPVIPTTEEVSGLERQGWLDLARNATEGVWFAAALFDEQEPEIRLAPNGWLERVLVARLAPTGPANLEDGFAAMAVSASLAGAVQDSATARWEEIWRHRRDAGRPFDEHFFSGPLPLAAPDRIAARILEAGLQDPVVLWFETVLQVRRVEWRPLTRARRKLLGQVVHRALARALRGTPVEGDFGQRPDAIAAAQALTEALTNAGAAWPVNRYWDSIRGEAAQIAQAMLAKVYRLPEMPFLAVETRLPRGTRLAVGGAGDAIELAGRIDLVLSDRPGWAGARVAVVDFKTGGDQPVTADRMACGDSLQLGLYLAAAKCLGAISGEVLMVKPDSSRPGSVSMEELPLALVGLADFARHRATGRYGALTPDRTEFSHGFEWPLACAPLEFELLEEKYRATFGEVGEEVGDE